jgi:hypothetical protein
MDKENLMNEYQLARENLYIVARNVASAGDAELAQKIRSMCTGIEAREIHLKNEDK